MASKGLENTMYQVARNFIESRNLALPQTPLFAIPVVRHSYFSILNFNI